MTVFSKTSVETYTQFDYTQELDALILGCSYEPRFKSGEIIERFETSIQPKISCGILTFNEEDTIERCIESVINDVDEIVLLDSGSTDRTLQIVRSKFSSVQVHVTDWNGDFSRQRNTVIGAATNDWIFYLDADEYIDMNERGKLRRCVRLLSAFGDIGSCACPIIQDVSGHRYNTQKRLFMRSSGMRYYGKIHEEPLLPEKVVPEFYSLNILIHHDGYSQSVWEKKRKAERNIAILKDLINSDKENLKWIFHYAKTLYNSKDESKRQEAFSILEKALSDVNSHGHERFLVSSLVLMCSLCFEDRNFKELEKYTEILNSITDTCADVVYFEMSLTLALYQLKIRDLVQRIEVNKLDPKKMSYLHSSKQHLVYLSGISLFQVGDIDAAFSQFMHLQGDFARRANNFLDMVNTKLGSIKLEGGCESEIVP